MTVNHDTDEIPPEELAALEQMVQFSDDELWAAAREQMPADAQSRMSVLMTKNNFGTITDEEYTELSMWVEEGNKLTLRKSYAMRYLMDRGYKITSDALKPIDDSEDQE